MEPWKERADTFAEHADGLVELARLLWVLVPDEDLHAYLSVEATDQISDACDYSDEVRAAAHLARAQQRAALAAAMLTDPPAWLLEPDPHAQSGQQAES